MPERYNFAACYRLLNTNPKTFQGWLKKAHIDPKKQVNAADTRQKYLTRKQILDLAEEHGRVVSLLDEDEKAAAPPMTIEALAEQLAANHAQMTAQIETNHVLLTEMMHSFQHILSHIQEQADHRQRFDQVEQGVEEPMVDAVPVVQPKPKEAPSSSTPSRPTTNAATKGKSKSAASHSSRKARGKVKPLPRTLVPLRVFAEQHQIDMKVADRAGESKKITVVGGKWLYKSRLVAKALDAEGQRSFYAYFSAQVGFKHCEQCPHRAEEQLVSSAG